MDLKCSEDIALTGLDVSNSGEMVKFDEYFQQRVLVEHL